MEPMDTWKFYEFEEAVRECIEIYDRRVEGNRVHYFGTPKVSKKEAYEILKSKIPEDYNFLIHEFHESLIISLFPDRSDWRINAILVVLTFLSTTFVGAMMFGINPAENPFLLVKGLPFSVALMSVLGTHELAHYVAAKRNGMRASLPYFIPFPSIIGTMGAIIIQRGMIPNRKALFDLGASGPLVGLIASIFVTAIGLSLPFEVPQGAEGGIILGIPPLFMIIAQLLSFKGDYIHPVAFAGWVGMFVTFLNMIPAGQLDGGHVLRSLISRERFQKVSVIISNFILVLGLLLTIFGKNGGLWIFWGLLLVIFSRKGHPDPVDDEGPLDQKRKIIAVLLFLISILCFTPVPFETNI